MLLEPNPATSGHRQGTFNSLPVNRKVRLRQTTTHTPTLSIFLVTNQPVEHVFRLWEAATVNSALMHEKNMQTSHRKEQLGFEPVPLL